MFDMRGRLSLELWSHRQRLPTSVTVVLALDHVSIHPYIHVIIIHSKNPSCPSIPPLGQQYSFAVQTVWKFSLARQRSLSFALVVYKLPRVSISDSLTHPILLPPSPPPSPCAHHVRPIIHWPNPGSHPPRNLIPVHRPHHRPHPRAHPHPRRPRRALPHRHPAPPRGLPRRLPARVGVRVRHRRALC